MNSSKKLKKAGAITVTNNSASNYSVGDIVGIDMGNGKTDYSIITKLTKLGNGQTKMEIVEHTVRKPHHLVVAVNKATKTRRK